MAYKAFISSEKLISVTPVLSAEQIEIYNGANSVPFSLQNICVSKTEIHFNFSLDLSKPCYIFANNIKIKAVLLQAFDTPFFGKQFNFDGELGNITEDGSTTFRVWAPTASNVLVNIYTHGDGDDCADMHGLPMTRSGGVWQITGGDCTGKYYTYTVDGVETADPYAHTCGINGVRSMVLDFSAEDVSPIGWESEHKAYHKRCGKREMTDCVIWETHVRDFSMSDEHHPHAGKYLAFGDDVKNMFGEATGREYLSKLGVTHVHILPISEYATVDQRRLGDEEYNAYNWGYDPLSHNCPSGVYSTNPYDGSVRVKQVREMVSALHSKNIGVVLDVVYNHTYNFDCPLGRTAPLYYYRRNEFGEFTNGSGCGNELASERYMCRKYIIDSVLFWAREYHIDGFRFDLMGLIDTQTMSELYAKLKKINPDIIVYGESWTGGATPLDGALSSSKYNLNALSGIGVFSDTMRDGLKGRVFDGGEGGYANGKAWENLEAIKFSIMGGTSKNFNIDWSSPSAGNVINYVSAHDNHTLWDKLCLSVQHATQDDRLRINKLISAVYILSQGVPFMQGGEELMRSKPSSRGFDHNSYISPDYVNYIRWNRLRSGARCVNLMEYYAGLIAVRRAHKLFRLNSPEEIEHALEFVDVGEYGVIAYTLTGHNEQLYIVINPLDEFVLDLPDGEWQVLVDGECAGMTHKSFVRESVAVKGKAVYVLRKKTG